MTGGEVQHKTGTERGLGETLSLILEGDSEAMRSRVSFIVSQHGQSGHISHVIQYVEQDLERYTFCAHVQRTCTRENAAGKFVTPNKFDSLYAVLWRDFLAYMQHDKTCSYQKSAPHKVM